MGETLYGHDLLRLLIERGGICSLDQLRADAAATYGVEATFCNCHGDTFDLEGVLGFLARKGKIALEGGRVSLGDVPACQH